MIIVGINAYHGDSSACLVVDGEVVSAIEEERIKRIKHWAGLPIESIKWCLSSNGLGFKDVDCIAVARDPSSHIHKKLLMGLTKTSMQKFVKDRLSNVLKMSDLKKEIALALGFDLGEIKAKVIKVEHHKAHIASAFLVSPFSEAACVSVDGFGDFLSTLRGVGNGTKFKIIDFVEYPHSLGIFYNALTQYLGFWNYGDEYKIMGLSAYGRPIYMDLMKDIVKLKNNGLFELNTTYFNHAEEGVDMVWEDGIPSVKRLFSHKLIDKLGSQREKDEKITEHHQNIASSVQAMYEEAFFHILSDTHKKTNLDSLVLAGGCIQNSLANGKITKETSFKKIYIPPASYDAGLAIGAAMYVWHMNSNSPRKFVMKNPYLGPAFTNEDIKKALDINREKLFSSFCSYELVDNEKKLLEDIALCLSDGKIVGWFQGRTEWGPRALGNRSILVDPRKKEMKDILNERIKRREWFRPFAPSILEEKTSEWFEECNPVPFMEKVYKIRKEKQKFVPAICHVDGTGRLQTVSSDLNPRYYSLIEHFERISSIPIVLNTSFNDNEPIVNTPEDAIKCFLNTKMDVLVMENFLIRKND